MGKKKITVVDITENTDNDADISDNNDVVEEPIKTIENEEPVIEPVIETVDTQPLETIVEEPVKEDKIVRTNELIKCPKCDKLVTRKTLKYSHKKTCSGEEAAVQKPIKTKAQPKPIPDIEDEKKERCALRESIYTPPSPVSSLKSPPKLERQNSRLTPTQITPEMMNEHRKQMRAERLKMRSDNMSSLFANSI